MEVIPCRGYSGRSLPSKLIYSHYTKKKKSTKRKEIQKQRSSCTRGGLRDDGRTGKNKIKKGNERKRGRVGDDLDGATLSYLILIQPHQVWKETKGGRGDANNNVRKKNTIQHISKKEKNEIWKSRNEKITPAARPAPTLCSSNRINCPRSFTRSIRQTPTHT